MFDLLIPPTEHEVLSEFRHVSWSLLYGFEYSFYDSPSDFPKTLPTTISLHCILDGRRVTSSASTEWRLGPFYTDHGCELHRERIPEYFQGLLCAYLAKFQPSDLVRSIPRFHDRSFHCDASLWNHKGLPAFPFGTVEDVALSHGCDENGMPQHQAEEGASHTSIFNLFFEEVLF